MNRKLKPIRTLGRDSHGAYMIELALMMPMFLLFVIGTFDIGLQMYIRSVLRGAVSEAARMNTITASSNVTQAADQLVRDRMMDVAPFGTLTFTRSNFLSFSGVGTAERFDDKNNNGILDTGDCFKDENENGRWDANRSRSGQGGADDIVEYKVTLTYDKLFPLYNFIGGSNIATVNATSVLRNQPYGFQRSEGAEICL
jgi:hypothetical protein